MSQPNIQISHWNIEKDGPPTLSKMIDKLSSEGYHCTDYIFPPGTVFPDHTHSVLKKDGVVSGQFKFGIYGKEIILGAGDTVVVPRETVHNAAVVGSEPVTFVDASK